MHAKHDHIIVGLGNPGAQYHTTRHNIGFMLIDRLMERYGLPKPRQKFQAEHSSGTIADAAVHLIKPLTFMNHSGHAVGQLARFYQWKQEQIIVVHDELELPVGKVRIKRGGGHGGHNGLKSIDAALGRDYTRVRVGIGRPADKAHVSHYVLHPFSKQEHEIMHAMLGYMVDHILLLLQGEHESLMNKLSLAWQALQDQ